jgi:hypothetical protein
MPSGVAHAFAVPALSAGAQRRRGTSPGCIPRQFVNRREVLRLRPAPRRNRAKKKARDFAQDDGALQRRARFSRVDGGQVAKHLRRARCIVPLRKQIQTATSFRRDGGARCLVEARAFRPAKRRARIAGFSPGFLFTACSAGDSSVFRQAYPAAEIDPKPPWLKP